MSVTTITISPTNVSQLSTLSATTSSVSNTPFLTSAEAGSSNTPRIVGAVSGCIVAVIVFALIFFFLRRCRNIRRERDKHIPTRQSSDVSLDRKFRLNVIPNRSFNGSSTTSMSSTTATQVTFGYKDPTAISQQLQQQQPLKSSFKSPSSYSLGNPGNVGVTSPSPNLMKHVRNASISASQNPHKLQGSRSTTPLVPTTDIPPSPNANPQNRKSVATTTFASEYVINLDRKSQYFPQLEKPAEK